jgi:beta-aspartyl-peptidase (threonine type)
MQRAKQGGTSRPNVLGDDPTAKAGTVGAVAIDSEARLAAATSTGGMANKTWGRVGDSPLIGAGTYASTRCAVSCTGWGEYFIRNAAAFDVHARMTHGGATLAEAVRGVIFDTLQKQVPGSGGLVALDADGHVELSFNTPGMYRGWIGADGSPHVAIYE